MLLTHEQSPVILKSVKLTEIYAWGTGVAAESLLVGVGALVMPIYTTGFGLNPLAVGWAISIARIIDAFVDPFIGHWSDRSTNQLGRRRPFMFCGAISSALLTIALWCSSPLWNMSAQFAYLLLVSSLFWVSFGVYTIPLYAIGCELVEDYNGRTLVASVRSISCAATGFVVSWLYWLALRPIFPTEISGIRWVSIGLTLLITAAGWMPVFLCKEGFIINSQFRRPNFLPSLLQVAKTREFIYLIVMRAVTTIASQVFSGLIFYIVIYYVFNGEKTAALFVFGLYGTVGSILGITMPPFLTKIANSYGKRVLLYAGLSLYVVNGIGCFFLLTPHAPYLLILMAFLNFPAGMFIGVFSYASLPDVCDLDELTHGFRREGLFSGVMTFLTKIEISISALLVGYILVFAGFNSDLTHLSNSTLTMLRLVAFLSYSCAGIVCLLFAYKFSITREVIKKTQVRLRSLRDTRLQSDVAVITNLPMK